MQFLSFLTFLLFSTATFVLAHPSHNIHRHPHFNTPLHRRATRPPPPPKPVDPTNAPKANASSEHLAVPLANDNNAQNLKLKPYKPSAAEMKKMKQDVAQKFSSTASNPLQGVIAAYVAPYGYVGYVALQLTSYFHTTPLTTDLTQAAIVTLPSATPSANFELSIANASAPFLGDIEGYNGPNWGAGNPGYGSMTVVQSSTYPASNRNNPTGLPSESNIWSLNVSTGELTAVWFNDDGTEVDCTIFYDATYGDMNFTGDLPAYLEVYPDNCYITSLYFVPLSYFGL